MKKKYPQAPGIYRFYDKDKSIIYIGKAKNLHNRINQYFTGLQSPKNKRMLSQAVEVDYLITDTEHQALQLEGELIRLHKPIFNLKLGLGSFYYILITLSEKFPVIKKISSDYKVHPEDFLIGPYNSYTAIDKTIITLQELFLIRSCTKRVFMNRTAPCQLYSLGLCSAPCIARYIDQKKYYSSVKKCTKIISDTPDKIHTILLNSIKQVVKQENYLLAAKLRDRMNNLMLYNKIPVSRDIIHFFSCAHNNIQFVITVVQVYNNSIIFQNNWFVNNLKTDTIIEFFKRYEQEVINRKMTHISYPEHLQIDDHHYQTIRVTDQHWEDIAYDYALESINHNLAEQEQLQFTCLANLINCHNILTIEALDISHQNGRFNVGVFARKTIGKKRVQYSSYRLDDSYDDYKSITQVLIMRKQDGHYPDCFVIDGGKGQLSIGKKIFPEMKILSIAKGGQERIYNDSGKVITLQELQIALPLLLELRDKVHYKSNSLSKLLEENSTKIKI